ncbi:MAG: hypothetical protein L6V78_06245 [Clostridium sp.]|nr:MAG: hypothetical protein L6V78_06245 [Clostridium sp.]
MHLPNMNDAKKLEIKVKLIIFTKNRESNDLFKGKNIFRTYGCQMNVHDSEEISAFD